MKYINEYEFFTEAVNFFEKGKSWSYDGKKVIVIGSIQQNKQVLKVSEVDEDGKKIGKELVVKRDKLRDYVQNLFSDSGEKDISKKKKWEVNGKKVIVISGAPKDNDKVVVQEVDTNDKIVGEKFIVSKKEIRTWEFYQKKNPAKSTIPDSKTSDQEVETKTDQSGENKQKNSNTKSQVGNSDTDPKIKAKYDELLAKFKESQKKLGKNESPGEGTRNRLKRQAALDVGYDETKAEADIASMKRATAYDVVDRLTTLIKDKKVKSTNTVLKYLEFINKKMSTGNVLKPSLN